MLSQHKEKSHFITSMTKRDIYGRLIVGKEQHSGPSFLQIMLQLSLRLMTYILKNTWQQLRQYNIKV